MEAILVYGAEPFEQIVDFLLRERPDVKYGKIAQVASEKKIFKIKIIYYFSHIL